MTLRERILAEAHRQVVSGGWAGITMGSLARQVGVSRQTVYNEIGTKQDLAEALVAVELERFLEVVHRSFDAEPLDAAAAVRGATESVLRFASENDLRRAIVAGDSTELLPLITTRETVLVAATSVVAERFADYGIDDPALVDVVVRTVLSHVIQPTGTPAATAAALGDLVARVAAGRPTGGIGRR